VLALLLLLQRRPWLGGPWLSNEENVMELEPEQQ